MTTGNRIRPESFGTLPENIVIRGWVPQTTVLQRASLFITHAGMNSVHDGLYYGVPLLLVPQQAEQMFTARRVVQLGAGLMLRKGEVNPQTVRETAARLLSDTQFRLEAIRIGETFRASGGMTLAVDEIEALLRKHNGSICG
jgi:MGT family glycosyltransferase